MKVTELWRYRLQYYNDNFGKKSYTLVEDKLFDVVDRGTQIYFKVPRLYFVGVSKYSYCTRKTLNHVTKGDGKQIIMTHRNMDEAISKLMDTYRSTPPFNLETIKRVTWQVQRDQIKQDGIKAVKNNGLSIDNVPVFDDGYDIKSAINQTEDQKLSESQTEVTPEPEPEVTPDPTPAQSPDWAVSDNDEFTFEEIPDANQSEETQSAPEPQPEPEPEPTPEQTDENHEEEVTTDNTNNGPMTAEEAGFQTVDMEIPEDNPLYNLIKSQQQKSLEDEQTEDIINWLTMERKHQKSVPGQMTNFVVAQTSEIVKYMKKNYDYNSEVVVRALLSLIYQKLDQDAQEEQKSEENTNSENNEN